MPTTDMPTPGTNSLETLAAELRDHPNVAEKLRIAAAYTPALEVAQGVPIGDDTAAIPDGDGGFMLFAAEGMMEGFIELDPWFAGYSAVMVNLSDIAAMGGRPTALVDVLWTHEASEVAALLWAGMKAASAAYGVPIVGGHTTRFPAERTPLLSVAVLGKAKRLISSFEARPGHDLVMAVDLRGAFRGENTVFWNASVGSPSERLRADLALPAELAEGGLLTAGKDISNGGLLGTLAMLLATSRCGALVHLDALPMPPGAELKRWLLSFPSYGYLFSVDPASTHAVRERFHSRQIHCEVIGTVVEGSQITLASQGGTCVFASVDPAASVPPATIP